MECKSKETQQDQHPRRNHHWLLGGKRRRLMQPTIRFLVGSWILCRGAKSLEVRKKTTA